MIFFERNKFSRGLQVFKIFHGFSCVFDPQEKHWTANIEQLLETPHGFSLKEAASSALLKCRNHQDGKTNRKKPETFESRSSSNWWDCQTWDSQYQLGFHVIIFLLWAKVFGSLGDVRRQPPFSIVWITVHVHEVGRKPTLCIHYAASAKATRV